MNGQQRPRRTTPAGVAVLGVLGFTVIGGFLGQLVGQSAALTPRMRIVSAHITAKSLRGNLSFLASDLLEGRNTPSRGLDTAAEYIAAQFRKLDLEPAAGDDYFQTVTLYPDDPASPTARNVAAILRGSDPKLKDTYVMLTSHYDHIGMAETGDDRIFNGANDDASGTASVIEVAGALASLHPRPKRSVLFILFCGEEKGLRGSRYYTAHPLVPLGQTIAQVNLEQVGRTDATEGMKVGVANVTGFDFSGVVPVLVAAGRRVGVKIVKDAASSSKYFERSDNGPIARAGIPAHTLSVAYEFPDYHGLGDEWQKIDYENMAKVDQAVGIAMLNLSSALTPPRWNSTDPATQSYLDAAKKLAAP